MQLASEAGTCSTQVLPDRIPGLAEHLGYLAAVETPRDAFHDLTLRRREAA
jgi:hypothetical protein